MKNNELMNQKMFCDIKWKRNKLKKFFVDIKSERKHKENNSLTEIENIWEHKLELLLKSKSKKRQKKIIWSSVID